MPQLLGKKVGPHGFGLMGFTWRATPISQEQAFATMRAALANNMSFWNGGEFYGTPEVNSMTLIREYLEKYPEDADKFVLCIKGGLLPSLHPDGSPENIRRSLDFILAQLGPHKQCIDMFESARRDPNVPLEVTFGVIDREYIKTGKVGGISLSEVSAETIHKAAAITAVAAVEVELSLFCTDPLENGIAEACAHHNIPFVAYSPLGRGILTGQIRSIEDFPEADFRRHLPRFQPGNFEINLQLADQIEAMAKKRGHTPAQLALGWLTSLQRRPGMPTIIPIPGATTVARVEENSVVVDLTDEEMAEIDGILAKFQVKGERYPEGLPINT
ncbi:pyridoxal reductase [Corynespora cassiicola Philippines]|uniref:Pyridoxal reductase n=1 Tax=Corynespora cassiicola Philippines TaxID=1448308 RepID=A0A2T2NPZ3_CORCC|nr:pyridoxal reductase [Corynespora cassiicola Philippines]